MRFNDHSNLEGTHAFLSASQHSWLNYDDDHLQEVYLNSLQAQRGTQMHEFAHQANLLHLHMPRNHLTINEFINDGLGYRMSSEVTLYYSPNVYGTADLISYEPKKKLLRIFDLKTGRIPVVKFGQLRIYAALFCLEYDVKPTDISFDLRLYQNDEIRKDEEVEPDDILEIIAKIRRFDKIINRLREQSDSGLI